MATRFNRGLNDKGSFWSVWHLSKGRVFWLEVCVLGWHSERGVCSDRYIFVPCEGDGKSNGSVIPFLTSTFCHTRNLGFMAPPFVVFNPLSLSSPLVSLWWHLDTRAREGGFGYWQQDRLTRITQRTHFDEEASITIWIFGPPTPIWKFITSTVNGNPNNPDF
jgi:hypothetical protein